MTKTRAALLSGLVLPGLGQAAAGKYARGVAYMAASLVLFAALTWRVFQIVYNVMMVEMADNPVQEIHRQVYAGTWYLVAPLIAVWAWSVVEILIEKN